MLEILYEYNPSLRTNPDQIYHVASKLSISPFRATSMNSRIDFSLLAKELADSLLPVCSSGNGLSGGREVVQRASFFGSRLWVLQLCLTLMQPELCVTRTPTNQTNHTNRALFRLAAELWPS